MGRPDGPAGSRCYARRVSLQATAPRRAAPGPARVGRSALLLTGGPSTDMLAGAALAAALTLLTFTTTGGSSLSPNTWEEIILLLAGFAGATALLRWRLDLPRWGGASFLLMLALSVLTAVSVSWSVQPDASWSEAGRAASYLAAFGLGIAGARLLAGRWRALAGAIALYTAIISAYALLTKVFPATLAPFDFLGRLSAPFDYWNATGVTAAMGIPAALWSGARRDRGRLLRGLSAPAIAVEVAVVVLSYSRSAVAAAILGVAVWFAFVPLRLRGAAMLAAGGAAGGAICAWALRTHPLTSDRVGLAVRTSAGHGFGLLLVIVLVLVTAAGAACAFAADTIPLAQERRRQLGRLLLCLVALVPLGVIAAAAASSRGLGGQISHVVTSLTSTRGYTGTQASRLVSLGNSRPLYWSEGLKVAEHHLLKGAGALGFATAHTRYTASVELTGHAHSYVIETFADLGILGLVISGALLASWSLAVRRTLGGALRRSVSSPPGDGAVAAERAALLTLLAVVVTFGVQSLVDWTWFVPGVAIPVLLCAGWLAGRGPLALPRPPLVRRRAAEQPVGVLAAAGLGVVTLLCAFVIWQPLRAQGADAASLDAATHGQTAAAFADARRARAEDPLSLQPLFQLAALYTALGQRHQAHRELVQAIALQPDNPQSWTEVGLWDLQHGLPHAAIGVLQHALSLDLGSSELQQAIAQAQAETAQAAAAKAAAARRHRRHHRG